MPAGGDHADLVGARLHLAAVLGEHLRRRVLRELGRLAPARRSVLI